MTMQSSKKIIMAMAKKNNYGHPIMAMAKKNNYGHAIIY
jgi:hypothetical protein